MNIFCDKCGMKLDVEDKFCQTCSTKKQDTRTFPKWGLFLFALFSLIIIGVFLSGNKNEPVEIRTTKNDSDEELINNLYRNTKYGFRIKFPEAWEIKRGDGIHIVQKAVSGNSTISIGINEFDLGGEKGFTSIKDAGSAKEIIDTVMEGARLKSSNLEIIDYGETKIDNEPAYWVEYSATSQILDNKFRMTNLVFFLAKDNVMYTITTGTLSNEYSQTKQKFSKSISTFVLEKY